MSAAGGRSLSAPDMDADDDELDAELLERAEQVRLLRWTCVALLLYCSCFVTRLCLHWMRMDGIKACFGGAR